MGTNQAGTMGTETDLEFCARKRLESELKDMNKNPSTHISFGPVSDDTFLHWQGIIIGPEGSPIEGFIFHLSIQFPIDYPFKPPEVKFQTKVFHPNIDVDGTVNLNILGDQWSSSLTTEDLLLSICSILMDPIVEEGQDSVPIHYKERGWKNKYLRCLSRIKLITSHHHQKLKLQLQVRKKRNGHICHFH
ncbi:Ubiquitin-conjugating enzyme E2 1 [Sarracenia purpurea var. burkii]